MGLNMKIFKYLLLNCTNMSNFHPLELVDRGSESQLQVGENLINYLSRVRVNPFSLQVIIVKDDHIIF